MKLTIKTPLEAVRSQPEIFVGHGFVKDCLFDDRLLAYRLISDPITYRFSPITIENIDGWWFVACKQDWLAKTGIDPVLDLFTRVIDFPEAGVNAIRSEILVNAFSDDVVTYGNDGKIIVRGCESGLTELEARIDTICSGCRVVAFRIRNQVRQVD
jgi:hypothetical protein